MARKGMILSVLAAGCVMAAGAAMAAEQPGAVQPHWGYVGPGAAAQWGDLDPAFGACKTGKTQSPVNIGQYQKQEGAQPLPIRPAPSPLEVVNNGHTIQVNTAPGSVLEVDGRAYMLKQFHFHTPSEHYLDGAPYPMEVHFVHQAADGALAVVGVMMKVGEASPLVDAIWQNIPMPGHTKTVESVQISPRDLMPAALDYYSYEGSLTTPPCSEGVRWFVLKDPVTLSAQQLLAFQTLFPINARPIQPLQGRVVSGN